MSSNPRSNLAKTIKKNQMSCSLPRLRLAANHKKSSGKRKKVAKFRKRLKGISP